VQGEGPARLDDLALEVDVRSALHGPQKMGVQRVEATSQWRLSARRADREGEPDTSEHHRSIPVWRPSVPSVAPPSQVQQIEEFIDGGLSRRGLVGHLSARETGERASP
jgi:hypothetical protein